MNKSQFLTHIATNHNCTKAEASRIVDIFTTAVTDILAKGEDISLVGFGSFVVSKIKARAGRNPQTGQIIQIAAYNQPRFKAGKKLKDSCNTRFTLLAALT